MPLRAPTWREDPGPQGGLGMGPAQEPLGLTLLPSQPQDQRLNIIATDHAYRRNFTATSLKPTRELDVEETINTIIDMIVSTAHPLPSPQPPQAQPSLSNPISLLSCLAET